MFLPFFWGPLPSNATYYYEFWSIKSEGPSAHISQPWLSVEGPCLSVSSIALFCLYYCNHFAGPDLCGCAGSFTTKLHGNRVKVEYLLEEAIWRQAVCTGGLASLVGSPLSLELFLPSSLLISQFWKSWICLFNLFILSLAFMLLKKKSPDRSVFCVFFF